MRVTRIFLGTLLFGLLFGPLYGFSPAGCPSVWAAEAEEPDQGAAVLCHHGRDGFLVSQPPGWVNLPEAAAEFGLCVMYVPAGYGFDDAPALIYPRAVPRPAGPDPVQVLVDEMLANFASRPDGDQVSVAKGPSLVSDFGLRFASRYFNQGPYPNNYELVAYQAADQAVLLLVLSARSLEERQKGLDVFWETVHAVRPVLVVDDDE